MAAGALVTEAAVVSVVRAVTVDAGLRGTLVCARDMALLARDRYVQADQGKICEVVVERDVQAPAGWRVALGAIAAELPRVNVARPVAGGAIASEVLSCENACVTRVAVHLLVASFERPLGVSRVIEGGRQPLLLAVAVLAGASEAAGVSVYALVAAFARFGQRILQSATSMAVRAVEARVNAFKGEAGLPQMIELRRLPGSGGVAVAALGAAFSAVNVIRRMAGDALLGRALVTVAEMTGETGDILVLVPQREGSLVVIEVDATPGDAVMTAATVAAEASLVRLAGAVARVAVRGRCRVLLARCVTAVAGHGGVGAVQRKISALVIELIAAELHDIGIAAEVLRMACTALHGWRGAAEPAVEAFLQRNVRGDVLVTGEAELRLSAAVALVMAVGAVLLVLRVRGGQLARHEQRLRIHGLSAPRCKQAEQGSREYPRELTIRLPHVLPDAASVDVHGHDVNDRRDHQHEDQWQVQRMPDREQSLVRLKLGDFSCSDQALVYVACCSPT